MSAHIHPNDYDLTVLSGTMYLGIGDKFDPARGEGLKAGGYLHLPKDAHHYEWNNEDTVIQLSGVGPVGMTYVGRQTIRGRVSNSLLTPPEMRSRIRCPLVS